MKDIRTYGMLALIAFVICLIFGANAWKSNLKIAHIDIEGNRIVGIKEIVQLANIKPDTQLYNIDLTTIQQRIASHHYIKDAIVERNLPNTIHIQVIERFPLAIVNRTQTLYLDEDGIVLPRGISNKVLDLPVISGISTDEPLRLGSSMRQQDISEALQLLSVMKRFDRTMYHNISEVQLRDGGDIILYSTEGGIPIVFGHGELASKLVRLEKFWNTFVRTQGPQYLQYIDLRFQDQIIARWNKEPSNTGNL
jgi:cell division protein FtsQ